MQYKNTETNQILTHDRLQNKLNMSFPKRKPPIDWEIYHKPVVQISDVEKIKRQRNHFIRQGITFKDHIFRTDDQTQGRLLAVYFQATVDPTYVVNWKFENGFVELNAQEILELGQLVREHVQGCFDREAELLSKATLEEGDIYTGWPTQEVLDVITEGYEDVT